MARKRPISCSFTIMLALELLREELKELYGVEVRCFQLDTSVQASKRSKNLEDPTISEGERIRKEENTNERVVKIEALIGPFEKVFPNNQSDDHRRRLRRVEVTCRLYAIWRADNVYSLEPQWTPHFLRGVIKDEEGRPLHWIRCHYDNGRIDGQECPSNILFSDVESDMCGSQMCAYVKFDRSDAEYKHGSRVTPRTTH